LVAPMLTNASTTTAPAQRPAPAPDVSCTGGAAAGGRGGGAAGAAPGSYIVKLTVAGKEYTKPVQVLEDRDRRD
jgi:hypothetical protein